MKLPAPLAEKIEAKAHSFSSNHEEFQKYKEGALALWELIEPEVRELVIALEFLTKNEPENGGPGACTFCDMGGAGYSSKGDRHHDDVRHVCPVVKAEDALARFKRNLGEWE